MSGHKSKSKSKPVPSPPTTASNALSPESGNGKSKSKPKSANVSTAFGSVPPADPISKGAQPKVKSKSQSKSKSKPKSKASKMKSTKSSKSNRQSVAKSLKKNSKSQPASTIKASKSVKSAINNGKSTGSAIISSKKIKSQSSKKSKKSAGQVDSLKMGSNKSPDKVVSLKTGSRKSNTSGKSISVAKQRAIATACTMKIPTSVEETNALTKVKGAKEMASVRNIEEAGYKIGDEITENKTDKFFKANFKGEEILCKRINLAKCTPRKRENLLTTALRVERFLCGGVDGQPKSKHFIRLFDIFAVDGFIFTFMNYELGKSLFCRLAEGERVSARSQRQWAVEMVQAVMKMQEVGVAHRSLTLHHILFDGLERVKVAAFSKSVIYWDPSNGGAALLQKPERRSRKNSHLPPECFSSFYDPSKVDIWSLGVIFVAMNTHRQPFNANSGFKFSAMWRQFVTVHPTNKILRSACNKIFVVNPTIRIGLANLLDHSYFHAPLDQIERKEVKTSIDPKHKPELFNGTDTSMRVGAENESRSTSKDGPTNGSSKKPKSKSKSKSKPSSKVSSTKSSASRGSSNSSSIVASDSMASADPGSEAASGSEGGSITDSVPESESDYESPTAESSSPEESASSAKPVSVASSSMASSASGSSNSSSKGSESTKSSS